jgi:hypothetical protein
VTIAIRPSKGNETAADKEVIWAKGERKYFSKRDWTAQITLNRFNKFAVTRKGEKEGYELTPSLRAERSNPSRHEKEEWIASSLHSSQ